MVVNGRLLNNYLAFQQTALRVFVCTHRCRGAEANHRISVNCSFYDGSKFIVETDGRQHLDGKLQRLVAR